MALSLNFEIFAQNGMYYVTYKNGVINIADHPSNMALQKIDMPVSSVHVRAILEAAIQNDEAELTSVIQHLASQGEAIK